jgi:hypothetical protein
MIGPAVSQEGDAEPQADEATGAKEEEVAKAASAINARLERAVRGLGLSAFSTTCAIGFLHVR